MLELEIIQELEKKNLISEKLAVIFKENLISFLSL